VTHTKEAYVNIAIIGAGNVGRALASSSTRAGHTVTVSSNDLEDAAAVAAATGARAARSNREAVKVAEVVILAVPYGAITAVLDELAKDLNDKVVVDVTNPLLPDYSGLATWGTSAAEQIQARVAKARVVKAFNTIFASRQADPIVDGVALDGFVAGDDETAKGKVLALVQSIGFRAIDAGPLTMARALEAMAFLTITLQIRYQGPWQSGWKLIGPAGVPEKIERAEELEVAP
jgi:NADPH-dependent F420 reductase